MQFAQHVTILRHTLEARLVIIMCLLALSVMGWGILAMKNFLNDNYKKKSEILDTLKGFLINSGTFNDRFVPYPHFLLLEDRSLTYYVESRKSTNPLLCGDVYSLTDKAKEDIEEALSEFRHQYGYNISYGVDNYGEIQFYAE